MHMRKLAALLSLTLPLVVLSPAVSSGEDRACTADCDGDGAVTVDEVLRAVNIALSGDVEPCRAGDADGDGRVTVDEILAAVAAAVEGCESPSATPTATATATPSPVFDPQNPPTSAGPLRQWLIAGMYGGWHAESAVHPSGGPHGGSVRTFLNDAAFDSLQAGNAQHPRGAAVVKELYFGTERVLGWAAEIKLDDDSAGGANWYWYEGASLAGRGLTICTSCHGSDYRDFRSKDFILTPFPLQ